MQSPEIYAKHLGLLPVPFTDDPAGQRQPQTHLPVLATLRHVVRTLSRSPGYSVVTVLMIALGIGLSTSAFSITNLALLRALPFPNGDRLVRVFGTSPESASLWHSPGNFLDLRAACTSFSHFSASYPDYYNVSVGGQLAEQTPVLHTTADFLSTIGVQPFLGRGFAPNEDQPGKGQVAIISHAYWLRKFDGNPGAIGSTLRINSETFTVIGVLPPYSIPPLSGHSWTSSGL